MIFYKKYCHELLHYLPIHRWIFRGCGNVARVEHFGPIQRPTGCILEVSQLRVLRVLEKALLSFSENFQSFPPKGTETMGLLTSFGQAFGTCADAEVVETINCSQD